MEKYHNEEEKISKAVLRLRGKVEELLPAGNFKIRLENGNLITAYLSGKMRIHKIRLTIGDEVQVELSPYDLTKGRITYRY